ncbi:hypothetical protein ACFVHW_32425 [Streptomyces sp. NPDC127110]|uniref:hypothetical protein n=1 Tax=Streptomyces sp. NPDC127110 TaxID=3345362 RepID=UPI003626934B
MQEKQMTITTSAHGPEPIDPSEPRAVQLRKAGEGALWYGLRMAGWSDEKISNSLATYRLSVARELAEQIRGSDRPRNEADDHTGDCLLAADLIDTGE